MSFPDCDPSLAFLCRLSRARRSARGPVDSIPQYVERRAALLTPRHLEELLRELPLLRIRFAGIDAPRFPHLPAQLKLLGEFYEDAAEGVFPGVPEAARKETALALRYVANRTDIIPDEVADIGYADDSLLVRTVLKRHRELFIDYCRFHNIPWSTVTLAP
jgi:hypothetical protein